MATSTYSMIWLAWAGSAICSEVGDGKPCERQLLLSDGGGDESTTVRVRWYV
jgi:hypothetical protein